MDAKCDMCGQAASRYKCPGCGKKTCSLPCVKNHKQEGSCDGIRKKSEFVPVKEFGDMNLLSDFRFLEDAGRKIDGAQRDNFQKRTRFNYARSKLTQQCKRLGINFLSMPYSMSRRRLNKSRYHNQTQNIQWTVKWVFPQANAQYTSEVADHMALADEINKYIHPAESDPVVRQRLRVYTQPGVDNVRLFLKAEARRADDSRFYELDKTKTLADNLIGKTIIEHPTIHVVLVYCCALYKIVDPEEESVVAEFVNPFESVMPQLQGNDKQSFRGRNHHRGRGRHRGRQTRGRHDDGSRLNQSDGSHQEDFSNFD